MSSEADARVDRAKVLARIDEIRREFTHEIEVACPGCRTHITPIWDTPGLQLPKSWLLRASCSAMYPGESEAIELEFRVRPDSGVYVFEFDLGRSDQVDIAYDAPVPLPPCDSDMYWWAFLAALEAAAATVRDNMTEVIRLMDPATFKQ